MIDQLIGQILAGKYRIERRWREDATSKTYFATQTLIDKPVMLKVLNPALAEYADVVSQFQIEARVLSRIANQHVLNVLDYGTDENHLPYIVLEEADGRTLREFIADEGGLSLERAARAMRQIADALTVAHKQTVVHGNLSGDKILIAERTGADFVKILDFGVDEAADSDDEKTVVRADLPFYKSPEQLSGTFDARADVYALGVILFEILTSKTPFTGENAGIVAQRHLHEIPPSLLAARPDLPPTIEQVVQRALAKNPNQRFQTAEEFADALANAARTGYGANAAFAGDSNAAAPRPAPAPDVERNNPYKTAFIVLAGIMLLSVGAIYVTGGFRNTPTTQMNSDPLSQPAQPINPATTAGEDLNNMGITPAGNSNTLDPLAYPPGVNPPPTGGIPPGLYPPGYNGNTIYLPPNQNSPFNNDNFNAGNTNSRPSNSNSGNVNARPSNVNAAASPKPTASPTTAAPSPTAAPAATPNKPKPAPANTAPPKPSGTTSGKPNPNGEEN